MENQKKMIEYDAKWAYWINPETFKMSKLNKQVPIDSIVLTKTHESSDDGRVFITTIFGVAKDDKVTRINKDKASIILTQQAIDYMKLRKAWPPFTTIKDVYKNGNVDITYAPSEYDKFILKLTERLVGSNAEFFLSSLKKPIEPQLPLRVELAKSSRATCRTCGKKIDISKLRIGEPYLYEEKISYKWHHLTCIAKRIVPLLLSTMEGYDDLPKDQKEDLYKIITNLKS